MMSLHQDDHVPDEARPCNPVTDIGSLLQASDSFFARTYSPIQSNRIRNIISRSSAPCETAAKIASHANETRILLHTRVLHLLESFIAHKRNHGTVKEQKLYEDMTPSALVRRLIKNRPLVFMDRFDSTILRDGSTPSGGDWDCVGTAEEGAIKLEDYLTYDEIQAGALLGVSSPTFFINPGGRSNSGVVAPRGTFQEEGVYVGLVGARFEREDRMESQHIIVSQRFSRPELGYGVDGAQRNPKAASGLYPFASLYSQPYPSSSRAYFPSYEEALADTAGRFFRLPTGLFFNIEAYKARIRIPIECLFLDANDRAQRAGTQAYIYLVGLGLGVWMKCAKQAQWLVDVVANVLQSVSLPHVADVSFSWFPRDVTTCAGASNGQAMAGAGGNLIAIHFNDHSPAELLPVSNPPKLLVASYAWDGNAFPGNEYWQGYLAASGDPTAACCSTISELQNAWVNSGFLLRQFYVMPAISV